LEEEGLSAMSRRASDWQPSPQDIDLVMAKLRPLFRKVPIPNDWATMEELEAECRDAISIALVDIAEPRPYAGQMRDKLRETAAAWDKARQVVSDLPPDAKDRLGLKKEL